MPSPTAGSGRPLLVATGFSPAGWRGLPTIVHGQEPGRAGKLPGGFPLWHGEDELARRWRVLLPTTRSPDATPAALLSGSESTRALPSIGWQLATRPLRSR